MSCKDALSVLLDHVDYTNNACTITEMIGACLPKDIIKKAKDSIKNEKVIIQKSYKYLTFKEYFNSIPIPKKAAAIMLSKDELKIWLETAFDQARE